MSFIHQPLCPQCGAELPLRALWKFAALEESKVLPGLGLLGKSGLLKGRIGIECPSCRVKLRIVQRRIVVVRAVAWSILAAGAGWLGSSDSHVHLITTRNVELLCIFVVCAAVMLLEKVSAPYLAQVRLVQGDEQLSYPLRSAYEGPNDSQ